LNARPLSTASPALARRRMVFEAQAESTISALTGKLNDDGLDRFELDFVETATWVKDLLLEMKHDAPKLQEQQKPFTPPPPTHAFCIQTNDRYTYDFSRPPPHNSKVNLHMRISDLGLSQEERHKLILLAGELYDPYKDVVVIERITQPRLQTKEAWDRARNRRDAQVIARDLIEAAK
ncbi:hypothetical protein BDK51DRAFT_12554, partial [Blyttiomyces helicus]